LRSCHLLRRYGASITSTGPFFRPSGRRCAAWREPQLSGILDRYGVLTVRYAPRSLLLAYVANVSYFLNARAARVRKYKLELTNEEEQQKKKKKKKKKKGKENLTKNKSGAQMKAD
jgi:hypothetical protein